MDSWSLHVSDSLPFLRTCKRIHDEATAVLYGNNIFYFDDVVHGEETLPMSEPFCDLPFNDFTTIYSFFESIGSVNRAKLHHVELGFSSYPLDSYPDEFRGRKGRKYERFVESWGQYVEDALKLLAPKQNLQTLEITLLRSVGCCPFNTLINMFLFFEGDKFVQSLRKIKGISELRCEDLQWFRESIPEDFHSFRWRMLRNAFDNFMRIKLDMEWRRGL